MMLELVPATNGVQGPRVTGFYPINDLEDHIMGKKIVVEKGDRYGMLKVVSELPPAKNYVRKFLMKCDCGNESEVRLTNLRTGHTISCGCKAVELGKKNAHFAHAGAVRHGDSGTRLYSIWQGIKSRCSNKNGNRADRYVGRGISVCQEWRDDYESFKDWALSNGYSDNLSIDRKHNDGDYTPTNCRWSTELEQMQNTEKSKRWHIKGSVFESSAEVTAHFDISVRMMYQWIEDRADCWAEFKYPKDAA